MDVSAQDDLRSRVGPQLALQVGAVHQVTGIRQASRCHPGRFGQNRKVRRDDDKAGLAWPVAVMPDVLRRLRAAVDRDTGDGDPGKLNRLVAKQANPVSAGTLRELRSEAEIMVSVHGRQRSDVRCRQPGEYMSEIARVPELNAVAQKENQVDSSLGERLECRVAAPVEVLGLEDVDPP